MAELEDDVFDPETGPDEWSISPLFGIEPGDLYVPGRAHKALTRDDRRKAELAEYPEVLVACGGDAIEALEVLADLNVERAIALRTSSGEALTDLLALAKALAFFGLLPNANLGQLAYAASAYVKTNQALVWVDEDGSSARTIWHGLMEVFRVEPDESLYAMFTRPRAVEPVLAGIGQTAVAMHPQPSLPHD